MLGATASAAASAAVVEVYKDGRQIFSKLSQTVTYANDLENNYSRLIENAKKLYARRDRIVAEANKYKTEQVSQECEVWMKSVMKNEGEVQELETKYEKVQNKKGKWRQFHSRAKLSKKMVNKCHELHNLWLEGKFEIGIVVEKLPVCVRTMHAPKTEDKPSLHCAVEEILDLLRDRNVRRIGLWGMVGIGKTTVMQNLNNNEEVAKMFDIVIWVHVSKEWSVEKLQHVIIDRLKLNMKGITCLNEIASRISMQLECKRYLLLLDEVWGILDLHLIGIPDNQKDSKVVLATRYRDICFDMETDGLINVKGLSEPDAWKMFTEKVGQNVNLPGIEPIAKQVVCECAGLPLLIDRVARNFRRKDNFHLWSDGLRSLQRWPSIKVQGMDELIDFLKFCYEELDGENKKFCFLYSALYPEDSEIYIDYLLECWRAEDFIHDANEFRDARDRGHTILHELINVSLLERSGKMNHVSMNKVLRNMALKISSESKNFKILVKTREGLQEPPNEEEWQQVNRISLMDNRLCTLPELSDCNNLLTLLLQRNSDLKVIPDKFFKFMKNLRVLDLHGTGIASLPPSMNCLMCLRALYLNSCIRLMELHYIEELGHLEVLDIRGTGINHLPNQIGSLVQLKCLRMSLSNFGLGLSRDVVFHQNVFSSLIFLEELRIDVDPNNRRWESVMEAVTEEVAKLTRLTSLSICFPNVDCLKNFISKNPLWKNFQFRFHFFVGYHNSTSFQILDCFEYQIRKCFKLANGKGLNPAISEVLAETEAFELVGHKEASSLSDFGIDSINKMRGCLIEGCDDIKTIINDNGVGRSALECLEKMYINNVPKLESIWEGPVRDGSLSQLTSLTLWNCPKLKKIFSNGMIKQLSKLQHLRIEGGLEIEEIITKLENNDLEPEALPNLKMLVLYDLPRVKSICTNDSLKWPSLEKIKISMCQLLTKLPFNGENAINLRCIEGQLLWWKALEWKEDAIQQRLQPICIFN